MLPRFQQLHSSSNQLCIAIRVIFGYIILASNYMQLQYFSFTFSHLTNSRLQVHIITIFWLQITSDYNILASHSATSPTLNYKSTTNTHYNNILASNYMRLQYFGFKFSHLTNSRLQVHIITIFRLQITSDYNISASHSATSPTLNYKYTL